MTSQVEIPPGSPEYIWVSNVIAAVEKRTGLSTCWNGKLYDETDPKYLGSANPDNSLAISRSKLLDVVRDAMQGKQLSRREAAVLRDAVLTTVHEAMHLSVPGARQPTDAADVALDEGLVESWTHANLDAVIYDLELDQVQPDIIRQPSVDTYYAYTAAVGALAHGLGTVAQVDAEEIRRTLLAAEPTRRWDAVADLIIDQRLDGLMPPEDRATVRRELTDRMRAEFGSLPEIQFDNTMRAAPRAELGHRVGVAAVIAVQQQVSVNEKYYRGQAERQAAVQAEPSKPAPWQVSGQVPGQSSRPPTRQIQFPPAARPAARPDAWKPGRGRGE